jgi:hypothetical protein
MRFRLTLAYDHSRLFTPAANPLAKSERTAAWLNADAGAPATMSPVMRAQAAPRPGAKGTSSSKYASAQVAIGPAAIGCHGVFERGDRGVAGTP